MQYERNVGDKFNMLTLISPQVDGKLIHLGSFKSFSSAVKAIEEAELKYFGFYKPEVSIE